MIGLCLNGWASQGTARLKRERRLHQQPFGFPCFVFLLPVSFADCLSFRVVWHTVIFKVAAVVVWLTEDASLTDKRLQIYLEDFL